MAKNIACSLLCFLFSLISCTQKKEIKIINNNKMKEELIYNQKKYSEKPYYTAKIHVQACYYEVLLNDIPVFSFGTKGGASNEIPLNYKLLKSGKQKLKIRLSPMFNNLQLSEEVDLKVELGFANIIGENRLGDFVSCGTFELPKEVKEKKLPFFEIEIPFEANVPWDYGNMLENAQNLKNNLNTKQLVDNFAHKFYNILKEKENSKYNFFMKNKIAKQINTNYSTEKEIGYIIEALNLTTKIKFLHPLPEYNIVYYGNGKLIQIKSKEKDEDGNRSVFKYTTPPLMEGGHDGIGTMNHLLYLPEGKTELEIF
jgi:hypothetical protein